MRVGVDLDGVVYPFREVFCEYVGKEYQEFPSWDFNLELGISDEEFFTLYQKGVDEGFIFIKGDPYPEAVAALRQLYDAGHTIHLVTDRFVGRRAHINTCEWLDRNAIPYNTLHFAKYKPMVKTDVFIDDNPKNVDALRDAGCKAFLLDCKRSDQAKHPWLIPGWDVFLQRIEEAGE